MPQRRDLFRPPDPAPKVTLPAGDPDDLLTQALHQLGVLTGVSEQEPGKASDALSAALGQLSPGKLLAAAKGAGAAKAVFAIPPKTAKEFARLMGELIEDPGVKRAWDLVRKKAPITLGHTRELHVGKPPMGQFSKQPEGLNEDFLYQHYLRNAESDNPIPSGLITPETDRRLLQKQSSVSIDPNQDPADLISGLGEEVAHTGQRIRLGHKLEPTYQEAGKTAEAAGGHAYWDNPFEIGAKKAGDNILAESLGLPKAKRRPFVPPAEAEKRFFHGTKRDFKDFDPRKNDKEDFLGEWTHVAEDPEHAARVPLEKDIPTSGGQVDAAYLDPALRPKPDYMSAPDSDVAGLNIRPVELSMHNPLDVTRGGLGAKMISDAEALLKNIPQGSWGRMFLGQALNSAKHYMKPGVIAARGGSKLAETVPDVARNLRDEMLRVAQNHPEAVKKAGFDALRYIDQPGWGDNYSVAVPSAFQVKPSIKQRKP